MEDIRLVMWIIINFVGICLVLELEIDFGWFEDVLIFRRFFFMLNFIRCVRKIF